MYEYRNMTPAERRRVLKGRREQGYPWHSAPHIASHEAYRIVSATCYSHQPILRDTKRLKCFHDQLLQTLHDMETPCAAWCVVPYHYHVLIHVRDIKLVSRTLGQLHGRTSKQMNDEDGTPGRKNWYRSQGRMMRSMRHFCTTLNYIHNSPVKHGYVKKWQEWPFSSVHWYLETKGRKWMVSLWEDYPLRDYGKGWDD